MTVLRMIKLFGWETRVREEVTEKREEELVWVWKRKVLGLSNNIIKYVVFLHIILPTDTIVIHSYIIPLVHMVVTYATFVSSHSMLIHIRLTHSLQDLDHEARVKR